MQKIKNIIFTIILLIPTALAATYIYAFSPTFTIEPHASKNITTILPSETFTILFDKPINKEYYKDHIELSPPTPMKAVINADHTQITLIPKKGWDVDQKYTVHIPQGRTKSFMPIAEATFHFTTQDYPQVIDVTPHPGEENVRLDIEDPIVVQFDKPTQGFFIDFTFDPPVPLTYQNNARKTEFKLLPQEQLKEGQKYTLTVRAKADGADDDTYVPIFTSHFTTLPPKPKTWAENLQERLVQAQQSTQPKITSGKYIDINLATQIMTIFENGVNKGTFLISSGKPGMNTPRGKYQIYNKHPRPWSNQYGLYMPYWMAISPSGKYGIHELPEWPGGYKEGQNHLGIPVSHGCVRLGVGPAEQVYKWADIGTPVIIY